MYVAVYLRKQNLLFMLCRFLFYKTTIKLPFLGKSNRNAFRHSIYVFGFQFRYKCPVLFDCHSMNTDDISTASSRDPFSLRRVGEQLSRYSLILSNPRMLHIWLCNINTCRQFTMKTRYINSTCKNKFLWPVRKVSIFPFESMFS